MTDNASKHKVSRIGFVQAFQCLGADCEDTCCKGWGMQLDRRHRELYEKKAPELLEAVTSGEAELIMKRDPETDYCVKFENGLCGIHAEYGTDFLGDACHFYPRVTRKVGEEVVQTATMSCPEVVRLALYGDAPFSWHESEPERVPESLKEYKPEELSSEETRQVFQTFLEAAGDEEATPERNLMRIVSVAHSLQSLAVTSWPKASGFYLKMADGRLPEPETNPANPYRLLHALGVLVSAAKKTKRPRFDETFETMEQALKAHINWETLQIENEAADISAAQHLWEQWKKGAAEALAPVLRKWLQTQLATAFFPFSGFGRTPYERAVILAVRFATVRLALMAHMDGKGNPPDEATAVRVIQSLARVMDHLADPELSWKIYEEAGWTTEAGIRGVLRDGS